VRLSKALDIKMKNIIFIAVSLVIIYCAGFFLHAPIYAVMGVNLNSLLYAPWVKELKIDNPIKSTYNKNIEFWCDRLKGCTYQNKNL
jgi:hypothetical protein